MSPECPHVALGAKTAMVAEALPPGVVIVLRVDGTELVSLPLAPCEGDGVGGGVTWFPV